MTETSRLLVVEDDETIAEVLVDVLADEGYDVRRATDGAQALQMLQEWRPDVIILDLTTPVVDGWTFRAEQLRLPAELARIPVIVLTGAYVAEHQTDVLAAEAIISKPFDLGEVLEAIGRACQRSSDPGRFALT